MAVRYGEFRFPREFGFHGSGNVRVSAHSRSKPKLSRHGPDGKHQMSHATGPHGHHQRQAHHDAATYMNTGGSPNLPRHGKAGKHQLSAKGTPMPKMAKGGHARKSAGGRAGSLQRWAEGGEERAAQGGRAGSLQHWRHGGRETAARARSGRGGADDCEDGFAGGGRVERGVNTAPKSKMPVTDGVKRSPNSWAPGSHFRGGGRSRR
jgi:hypothetical protein